MCKRETEREGKSIHFCNAFLAEHLSILIEKRTTMPTTVHLSGPYQQRPISERYSETLENSNFDFLEIIAHSK